MCSRKLLFRSAASLVLGLLILSSAGVAWSQDRYDDRRGGDRHGGMRGIGTGIGIGIGIGQTISQQPVQSAPEPTVRRTSKKSKPTSRASRPPETCGPQDDPSLKFEGKPDDIAFNPTHTEGEMGKLSDHKNVLVLRDGQYLRRSYYTASKGDNVKRLWYEIPISKDDPAIPNSGYVAHCGRDGDSCTVVVRDPPAIAITWQDAVDWWNGPLKVADSCRPVSRLDPNSKIGDSLATCSDTQGTCSGSCELFDAGGASRGLSPPASMTIPTAGGVKSAGVTCKCNK